MEQDSELFIFHASYNTCPLDCSRRTCIWLPKVDKKANQQQSSIMTVPAGSSGKQSNCGTVGGWVGGGGRGGGAREGKNNRIEEEEGNTVYYKWSWFAFLLFHKLRQKLTLASLRNVFILSPITSFLRAHKVTNAHAFSILYLLTGY